MDTRHVLRLATRKAEQDITFNPSHVVATSLFEPPSQTQDTGRADIHNSALNLTVFCAGVGKLF